MELARERAFFNFARSSARTATDQNSNRPYL